MTFVNNVVTLTHGTKETEQNSPHVFTLFKLDGSVVLDEEQGGDRDHDRFSNVNDSANANGKNASP